MDWIVVSFAAYTLVVMVFGICSAKFSKQTSADFFLADRGLGAWVAALSASASAESGWVTLGLVGIAYRTGVGAMWLVLGTVIAFLFNWLVLAIPLRRFSIEQDAITLPDVLAANHRGSVAVAIRLVAVLIILSMLTAYVAAQLNAAGKAFEATFDWRYQWGVAAGAGITLAYTLIGGFRAVAWTDVLQAALMICGVILLPIVMIVMLGGPMEFWNELESLESQQIEVNGKAVMLAEGSVMTSPWAQKSGLAVIGFLAVWFGVPLGNPGQPHILVRLMATRDDRAIRRAAVISTVWVCFLFTGAVLVGLSARVMFGASIEDPERALPHAAVQLLPAPLAGLMIAAIVAAMCSTADSQMLVSASAVSHDVYVRMFGKQPSDKVRTIINRTAVLLIALVATVIATREVRAVFDFVLYAWDGLGAAFGPALILTLLWKRTTGWGILIGMIVGVATVVIWRETLHAHLYSLIPAFAFAFASIVAVSLLTTRASNDS
ncbi:MAG: sodium/proline symporter [Pirellulaceae bacterium]|jgi:sodium/proline symporter|nr:sodium/proline symporter [Pirellulaceae bacterium]MDP7019849.1 sodium/proline symporter [Pirellulaceae bacterium]